MKGVRGVPRFKGTLWDPRGLKVSPGVYQGVKGPPGMSKGVKRAPVDQGMISNNLV